VRQHKIYKIVLLNQQKSAKYREKTWRVQCKSGADLIAKKLGTKKAEPIMALPVFLLMGNALFQST